MLSINQVNLMGNLGADPVLSTSKTGKVYCRFNVATNYVRKNENGEKESSATWHRIKVFGKTAEYCGTYLKKGSTAYVNGYISNSTYKKADGTEAWTSEIIAQQVSGVNTTRLPLADFHEGIEVSEAPAANEIPF